MEIEKPLANEFANFYRGYTAQVGDEKVVEFIARQATEFAEYLKNIDDAKMDYRYGEDKWTVAQVLGHIIDTERVMSYRILRFSRKDKTPIAGFEENDYVMNADFQNRSKSSLMNEFNALRSANYEMISNLSEDQTLLTGESNGAIFSVRALIYILAGHVAHHWMILRTRYEV
ncbi:MAG: DinB family protein [Marinoscillum sp.]